MMLSHNKKEEIRVYELSQEENGIQELNLVDSEVELVGRTTQ
jgi:hypothetical protein